MGHPRNSLGIPDVAGNNHLLVLSRLGKEFKDSLTFSAHDRARRAAKRSCKGENLWRTSFPLESATTD